MCFTFGKCSDEGKSSRLGLLCVLMCRTDFRPRVGKWGKRFTPTLLFELGKVANRMFPT